MFSAATITFLQSCVSFSNRQKNDFSYVFERVSLGSEQGRNQKEDWGIDISPGNYKYLKGIWIDLLSQAEKNIFSMTIPSAKKTFLVAPRVQNYRSIYLSRLFQRKSLHTHFLIIMRLQQVYMHKTIVETDDVINALLQLLLMFFLIEHSLIYL